ncbi:kinase-like protein [Gyrodon lividus]|nr:kinase-like protein [Gyrodon lividus]
MATNVIGPTLGVAQLAATLSGVPFASGGVMVLQMINSSCSQVSVHKLVQRCTKLLNIINERSAALAGTEMIAAFDEAEASGQVKSTQIARDLDKCHAEVNTAMERLHVSNPITMLRMQQQSMDMMQYHQATLEERFQQLLISPREVERAVQQHNTGGNGAHELMRLGQERLVGIRGDERIPDPPLTLFGFNQAMVESPVSSRPPSPITTVQNQIEQALLDLHRLTNIPPTIPILNNQVKKTNGMPVRGGPYSHIFEGRWLGEKKVALKTLRILDEHDPKAKRLQMRFEHEIIVWSQLKHENVLRMLGIVTNMGLIHIVSPWQSNDVRNYRRENPDANPLKLLSQAAKGLEYLHSQHIVHGQIKCNNLLVDEEGTVSLPDFGLTQVLTDIVGKATMDLANGVLPPRPEEPEAMEWMTDGLWEVLNRCWKWKHEDRMAVGELSPCLEEVSESLKR